MYQEEQVGFVAIEHTPAPLLYKVEKTYLNSFPEAERRAFDQFCDLLNNDKRFRVYALLHAEEYIGFITSWTFDTFIYIEHFAIDASARNGGFGGMAIRQLLEQAPLPVVLEVETPDDEISRRRIAFYERLGFRLDRHPYTQPPYRPGGQGLPMLLMSHGPLDLNHQFEDVKTVLYRHVYNALH